MKNLIIKQEFTIKQSLKRLNQSGENYVDPWHWVVRFCCLFEEMGSVCEKAQASNIRANYGMSTY